MVSKKIVSHRRQLAKTLLLQGMAPRRIASELNLAYTTILKYLHSEDEKWNIPEGLKAKRSTALANTFRLYVKLGFTDSEIAQHFNCSKQWVNNLRRRPQSDEVTIPVADIELLGEVFSVDGKRVEQGFYTVYDLSDTQVFLKSKSGLIFKVNIEPLLLRVRIANNE